MSTRHHTKKRLYLSPPAEDKALRFSSLTRIIPPSPSPPPPPPISEPEPLPPPPIPEPIEEEPPIEVISVDVEPSHHHHHHHQKKKKSRSPRRSTSHDREVLVERDHYIPYPVRVEPQYDTYRYVEAPRRHVPPPPPPPERRMITERGDDERIHIDITERRRVGEREGGYYR